MKKNFLTALALALSVSVSLWAAEPNPGAAKAKPKASPDAGRYDLLYQTYMPTFADLLVGKIKEVSQQEIAKRGFNESDEDYATRKQFLESGVAAICKSVKELETVSLGWKLNRGENRSYLDLRLVALKDTDTAKRMAQLAELKTAFAGFRKWDAALAAHWLGQVPASEAEANAKVVQAVREKALKGIDGESASNDEKAIRKELLNKLFDVLAETVAKGQLDGAITVVAKPNAVTVVAGGYVADGEKLESVVKPVAKYMQEHHPAFAGLKLDAEKFQGVNLHTLSIPAPQGGDRDKFVQLFGESLEIVAGFGKQAVYVAAGKNAMSSLQAAIEKSATPTVVPVPFEIALSLKAIADFVGAVGRDHEQGAAQLFSGMMGEVKGKDHVRLTAKPIERGLVVRLEAEEGVLQLIGSLSPEAKAFISGK